MTKPLGLIISLCLTAAAAERQIALQPSANKVGQYEKIEFSLQTDAVCANPYDPDEVDLRIEFTTPSGKKLVLPAFYYQHLDRQQHDQGGKPAEWLCPVGRPSWKARFAPGEPGTYSCVAKLTDRRGSAQSATISFECVRSPGSGFVRVSRDDPRFLEFDSGTAFFAIGQNVAFVKDSYTTVEMLKKVGENGANFARVWACSEDWALAIEARKSAFGRSWAYNPPVALLPGREGYHSGELCVKLTGEAAAAVDLSPCYPVALRPNTSYRLSAMLLADGDKDVPLTIEGAGPARALTATRQWASSKHEFTSSADQWWLPRLTFRLNAKGTVLLRNLSLKEKQDGPELLDEADPNRPAMGMYNQTDCFMLDRVVEAAEQSGIYLQLVLLTRDHYMRLLERDASPDYDRAIAYGRRLLRYAVARWGYSTHIAVWEYFNEMDPGLPTDRFYAELGSYLEQVDIYHHLRATSAWGPSKKDREHPKLDTADLHYYLRPAEGAFWKDEVAAVLDKAKSLRQQAPGKPALFSEFGMTTNDWQRPPEIDQDREFVHLHNALWTSALSGLSSTVCHWYWDDIHKRDLYRLYRPLAAFVADIPFTKAKLRAAAVTSDGNLRVVGLQGTDCAYLWVSDPQATWWNLAVEKATPKEIKGALITIEGLENTSYDVQWWNTYDGGIVKREALGVRREPLRLTVPPFTRDIACKLTRGR